MLSCIRAINQDFKISRFQDFKISRFQDIRAINQHCFNEQERDPLESSIHVPQAPPQSHRLGSTLGGSPSVSEATVAQPLRTSPSSPPPEIPEKSFVGSKVAMRLAFSSSNA